MGRWSEEWGAGGIGMEKNRILALLAVVEFYVDIVVVV